MDTSPSVANGVVYVNSADGNLYAFDAAGKTNCSGTPKTCSPLWTYSTGGVGSPTVANGFVYVGGTFFGILYAFDAAGMTNCSGTPKTCGPVWTAVEPAGGKISDPAVAKGVVYVGWEISGGRLGIPMSRLLAFDAAGNTNCSGTLPKSCTPLWTGLMLGNTFGSVGEPTVAKGVVYVSPMDEQLYAFDAAGNTNCSGTPKTCAPLWTTGSFGGGTAAAVANGVLYAGGAAFDAAGNTNCSGTPKICSPMWQYVHNVSGLPIDFPSSPAVANGVVYFGSSDDSLYAFDAAGHTNCSGTPPKSCTPLWSATTGGSLSLSSPAVANGVVYIGSADDNLYAYSRP